jgi:hypothetical protein
MSNRTYFDQLRADLLNACRRADTWAVRAHYLVRLLREHGVDAFVVLEMSKDEVATRLFAGDYSGFNSIKMEETMATELKTKLDQLAELANQAGAEGVWIIRGIKNAQLLYEPTTEIEPPDLPGVKKGLSIIGAMPGVRVSTSLALALDLAYASVIVVMRFPASDGGEPGIESK